jgi:hypothetical protein
MRHHLLTSLLFATLLLALQGCGMTASLWREEPQPPNEPYVGVLGMHHQSVEVVGRRVDVDVTITPIGEAGAATLQTLLGPTSTAGDLGVRITARCDESVVKMMAASTESTSQVVALLVNHSSSKQPYLMVLVGGVMERSACGYSLEGDADVRPLVGHHLSPQQRDGLLEMCRLIDPAFTGPIRFEGRLPRASDAQVGHFGRGALVCRDAAASGRRVALTRQGEVLGAYGWWSAHGTTMRWQWLVRTKGWMRPLADDAALLAQAPAAAIPILERDISRWPPQAPEVQDPPPALLRLAATPIALILDASCLAIGVAAMPITVPVVKTGAGWSSP